MALKWTLLPSLALFVLFISVSFYLKSTFTPAPSNAISFANGVWTIAGLLLVALWAWFIFRSRNPPAQSRQTARPK